MLTNNNNYNKINFGIWYDLFKNELKFMYIFLNNKLKLLGYKNILSYKTFLKFCYKYSSNKNIDSFKKYKYKLKNL